MDFSKLFKNITKEMGSGLTSKIGNPPKLNVKPCFCMWSDLLGFSNIFIDNNWKLNLEQQRMIHDRLKAAHSAVLYFSSLSERNLILNDGIAKVFHPRTKFEDKNNILSISLFFRSCIELHMSISQTEHENGYPGCRTVIAFGENVEYLIEEVRFDDYVVNYSKPKGAEISDIAKRNGNPLIIYNPKELQMNTAFSKAYILEGGGSKIGLPGNNLYIDQSAIDAVVRYAEDKSYVPEWIETDDALYLWIPYNKGNFRKVVMGFTFDKKIIEPQNLKYHTKVYHLLRLYPFDEPTDEFYFDVNEYLYK